MSGELTIEKVQKTYDSLKKEIRQSIKKGNYKKAFDIIDGYALIVQNINDHFRVDEFENLFNNIAQSELNVGEYNNDRDEKTVIFYDRIGTTICLGLQYLRGLWNLGYKVLYIFEHPYIQPRQELLDEVQKKCVDVKIYKGENNISKAKEILKYIKSSKATKIISHCSADGALCSSVLYAVDRLKRYRIVPGDHHFNLGVECYDYFFDYRDFAIQISVDERKIPINKIYKLPYYPILDNGQEFHGFPSSTEGKIKILTAGAEYKFHGSNWFFDFSKWILENYPNVVILFMGGESPLVTNFVKSNHLEDNFLLLGYRKDFVACMRHVDIFLNSYPMGGGLVGLTAINLGIPVLSFYNQYNAKQNSLRSFMGAEDIDSPISFCDDIAIKDYAKRLIEDEGFRFAEGRRMKSITQTKEKFESRLGSILENKTMPESEIPNVACNLDKRVENYMILENEYQPGLLIRLNLMFGPCFVFKYPHLYSHIWNHKKEVTGIVFGSILRSILPQNYYSVLLKKYKHYFY